MHWCVYGCYILKIGWRLLAVFRSNRDSIASHAVNSEDKCLYLLLLFIPYESHFALGDAVSHWATKYKASGVQQSHPPADHRSK